MLKLKPRLAAGDIPERLLRRKKCTICGEKYLGHFSSRQCVKPECRAEAIRARGRVSSQRIRDEWREPIPKAKCAWCRDLMDHKRITRKTCSDACRAAFSRANRARRKQGNARGLAVAQKGQTAALALKAPARRRMDIRDWPAVPGCIFEVKWPDGFAVQAQITRNTAVLTADAWVETIDLAPDGKSFVCDICKRLTPILHEGPEQFACGKCTAGT